MDADTMITRNPRVEFRKLAEGGGAVLLHLDTAAYHGLNETGGLIWDEIGDGVRFGELLRALRDRITDPPRSLGDDVEAFVHDLVQRDLLWSSTDDGEAAGGISG
jgi:hypothetical protein